MRLATVRLTADTSSAARVEDDHAVLIDGCRDLSALLEDPGWYATAADADGEHIALDILDYAPVVPRPGKIICVGLNYATHITEMGRDLPQYPTLFAKFKEALTGPNDTVQVPKYASSQLDWEAELAFVMGRQAYQVSENDAGGYIAGYSVINDYTMRDYQYRTLQWDQGKTFAATSGFGPHLVTDYRLGTRIETHLDGELMQSASTDDLVFTPAALVDYISHIVPLQPGDVVITGTTGGVGHAQTPPRYVQHGQTVKVSIDGLGAVSNKTLVI